MSRIALLLILCGIVAAPAVVARIRITWPSEYMPTTFDYRRRIATSPGLAGGLASGWVIT
jgi:hypothetical protein